MSLVAEGDREVTLAEVVELADAVATLDGIASGAGTMTYGAQIVVEAATSDDAVEPAVAAFVDAAARAGLPVWPIARAEVIGEDEFPDVAGGIP